jgi:anti-anti-sigma factor
MLVIVDLRQLTFIDSTGLHVLIEADARARRIRRRLVLARGPARIDRLFQILGLSERLKIIDLKPVLVSPPAHSAPAPPNVA